MSIEIKVLGPGCAKCKQLEKVVRTVVEENAIDAEIIKIEDIVKIMNYGVMMTPALLINGKLVLKGYVPTKDEVLTKLKGI